MLTDELGDCDNDALELGLTLAEGDWLRLALLDGEMLADGLADLLSDALGLILELGEGDAEAL